jgi:hypothetical protein
MDDFDILLDSGRSALALALSLVPKKYGNIPIFGKTCRVVHNVINFEGFKSDIFPLEFNAYSSIGNIDAVVATQPCDMSSFLEMGVPVIEDSALYWEKGYRGLGDFTIFSFNWGKPICLGGGGGLNIRDPQTREKARSLVKQTGSYWHSRLRGLMFEPNLYQLGKRVLYFYEPRYDQEQPKLMNPKLIKLLEKKLL